MEKNNILLLDVPNVSLVNKRLLNDINAGGIAIAGSWDANQYSVDHYDLNAKLNRYRQQIDNFEFSDEDFSVLLKVDKLNDYLIIDEHSESYLPHLTNWLLQDIDVNSYDAIGISFTRRSTAYWPLKMTFHFAIILTSFLKRNFNEIEIFIGGNTVFGKINKKHLENLCMNIEEEHHPTSYIRGTIGHEEAKYLIDIRRSQYLEMTSYRLGHATIRCLQTSFLFTHKSYPKPEFKNHSDILVAPTDFIPKKLLEQYSKLKSVEPFQIYPYKFTDGCRSKCSFCAMATIDGFAHLTPDETVDHLEAMANQGAKHFRFFNDQINWKKSWLLEFCNEIIKRNLKITWNDSANLRLGNQEIYNALSEAGCISLWYGTETINDEILKTIQKNVTGDRIKENLTLAHETGIWNRCNFIHNFPWETSEQFQELINFIKDFTERKIMNGYQDNVFCVQEGGEYLTYPSKYNIEILEQDGITWDTIKYNERNGKQWKEIVFDGNEKQEIFRDRGILFSAHEREIRANDFILTALHKAKYTFKEIIQFYDDILTTLTEEEILKWAQQIGNTTLQFSKTAQSKVKKIENWDTIDKTSTYVLTPEANYEK